MPECLFSFACVSGLPRPPIQLWGEVYKQREEFYRAMDKLKPEDIQEAVPIQFPVKHEVVKNLYPGVSRFPVEEAAASGLPVMNGVLGRVCCMAVPKKDEAKLNAIFTIASDFKEQELEQERAAKRQRVQSGMAAPSS